jgi:hypothetical protein
MRFQGLPDLPALNETLPGVVVDGWFGVVAPSARRARSSRASIARSASFSRARRFSSA